MVHPSCFCVLVAKFYSFVTWRLNGELCHHNNIVWWNKSTQRRELEFCSSRRAKNKNRMHVTVHAILLQFMLVASLIFPSTHIASVPLPSVLAAKFCRYSQETLRKGFGHYNIVWWEHPPSKENFIPKFNEGKEWGAYYGVCSPAFMCACSKVLLLCQRKSAWRALSL